MSLLIATTFVDGVLFLSSICDIELVNDRSKNTICQCCYVEEDNKRKLYTKVHCK